MQILAENDTVKHCQRPLTCPTDKQEKIAILTMDSKGSTEGVYMSHRPRAIRYPSGSSTTENKRRSSSSCQSVLLRYEIFAGDKKFPQSDLSRFLLYGLQNISSSLWWCLAFSWSI